MGGAPTRLAQRQSPPSGKANAGAGRRISPSSLGPVPPPLRQQLRFARDWTELELRRWRSSAECVRPPRGGSCPQALGSRVRWGRGALRLTGAGWRGAGGAPLPPGRGWESSRRASQLPGRSTPRCRRRAATSGGRGTGGPGDSPADNHRATAGGGGGKWGAPGGSPEGGGRGIWGKGRVCSSASYFNSLPAFAAGPSAVVLPRCLPHPPPSPPPPRGCLPPLPCPALRGFCRRRRCSPPVLFGWVPLMADRRRQCCWPTAGGQTRDRGQLPRKRTGGAGARPVPGRCR